MNKEGAFSAILFIDLLIICFLLSFGIFDALTAILLCVGSFALRQKDWIAIHLYASMSICLAIFSIFVPVSWLANRAATQSIFVRLSYIVIVAVLIGKGVLGSYVAYVLSEQYRTRKN